MKSNFIEICYFEVFFRSIEKKFINSKNLISKRFFYTASKHL